MSDDNVVILKQITRLDIPVERVVSQADKANLAEIVVIGFDQDGEFYFSASKAGGHDVLWLLERARHKLMAITDAMERGDVPC